VKRLLQIHLLAAIVNQVTISKTINVGSMLLISHHAQNKLKTVKPVPNLLLINSLATNVKMAST